VWNLGTGEEIMNLLGHSDVVTGVIISKDGKKIISSSCDKTIKIWNLETG